MEIIITGQPQKVSKKIIREAIKFYASTLMSSRLLKTLQIYVRFVAKDTIDCKAITGGTMDNMPTPRIFDIDIVNNMSKKLTLTILGHEMVHVKQFAKGEIKEYERFPGKVRYRGQIYKDHPDEFYKWSDEYFEYLETPWEIEAAGREYSLYARFTHYLRMKDK